MWRNLSDFSPTNESALSVSVWTLSDVNIGKTSCVGFGISLSGLPDISNRARDEKPLKSERAIVCIRLSFSTKQLTLLAFWKRGTDVSLTWLQSTFTSIWWLHLHFCGQSRVYFVDWTRNNKLRKTAIWTKLFHMFIRLKPTATGRKFYFFQLIYKTCLHWHFNHPISNVQGKIEINFSNFLF